MGAMKGAGEQQADAAGKQGEDEKTDANGYREMNFPESSVISQCVLELERAKVK